jgi:hypothetical protein
MDTEANSNEKEIKNSDCLITRELVSGENVEEWDAHPPTSFKSTVYFIPRYNEYDTLGGFFIRFPID